MATVFFNSAATGANNGTSWTDAYTSLFTSLSNASANDVIVIAITHSEVDASSVANLTFPANCTVISSDVSGVADIVPTKATSRQYYTDTIDDDVVYAFNNATVYGIWFGARRSVFISALRSTDCTWEYCIGGRSGTVRIGGSNTSEISLRDTFLALNDSPTVGITTFDEAKVLIEQMTLTVNTWNNSSDVFSVNDRGSLIINGGDVSSIGAGTPSLINLNANSPAYVELTNIHMGANMTTTTSNIDLVGKNIIFDNCNSTGNQQQRNIQAFAGSVTSNTSTYEKYTNPDGTQSSFQINTNANAKPWAQPIRFKLWSGWADFSTAKTLTFEIANNSATSLTEADVWLEFLYPETGTSKLLSVTGRGDYSNPSNHATSTASWTGLDATNTRQSITITSGTGQAGVYEVYVNFAKTSDSMFIDPEPAVS